MEEKKKSPRTVALLTRLPMQIINLAKIEINNAKTEITIRVKKLAFGIVYLVLALMILFWVIATLLAAAVAGLSVVFPVWLSALIVSGVGLLLILLLVVLGIMKIKRGNPVPADTVERVKEDFEYANTVKQNVDKVRPQPGKKGKFK